MKDYDAVAASGQEQWSKNFTAQPVAGLRREIAGVEETETFNGKWSGKDAGYSRGGYPPWSRASVVG